MMLNSKPTPQHGVEEEWLSALLDGELDDDHGQRALKRLSTDRNAARSWSEYCLIGDALRGELRLQPGLAEGVRAALEAEPTVLAPSARRKSLRPMAWVAAAATMAGVTWVIVSESPQGQPQFPMAQAPEAIALQANQVMPYLAAHQDFAQVVIAQPEMRFTRVTLVSVEGSQ